MLGPNVHHRFTALIMPPPLEYDEQDGSPERKEAQAEDDTRLLSSSDYDSSDDETRNEGNEQPVRLVSSYYEGPPARQVSLTTEIGADNVGYRMLQRQGWRGSGVGLGVDGSGACSRRVKCVATQRLIVVSVYQAERCPSRFSLQRLASDLAS
jgi:hypothetical protein